MTVFKFVFFNLLRAKWLLLYGVLFATFATALLRFSSDTDKATASLLNVVLFIVPMVAILYGSAYWYNAEPFTHLLLTQPVRRAGVYLSTWFAVSLALAGTFAVSCALPLAFVSAAGPSSGLLLMMGVFLTFIFTSVGMLIAVFNADRMKGIGVALVAWLYFAILHDALVFLFMSSLKDYPIEIPSMVLMVLNPIDLARVSLLLTLDLPAMMGYTGRVLQRAISSSAGVALSIAILHLWILVPTLIAVRRFNRRDL